MKDTTHMANPKDTKTPPERGTTSSTEASRPDASKPPERGAQEQVHSTAQGAQENGGTEMDDAAKKRIADLEDRLLAQSEALARAQRETAEQLAEFRKLLQEGGPALTHALRPALDADLGMVSIINQRHSPVTLNTPNGAIRLAPGSNAVDGKAWEEAKRHPQVQQMLKLGMNPFSKEGLREAGTTTKGMDLTNALLLVQASTSVEAVDRALAGEERREVLDAAANQVKRIRSVEERIRSGG